MPSLVGFELFTADFLRYCWGKPFKRNHRRLLFSDTTPYTDHLLCGLFVAAGENLLKEILWRLLLFSDIGLLWIGLFAHAASAQKIIVNTGSKAIFTACFAWFIKVFQVSYKYIQCISTYQHLYLYCCLASTYKCSTCICRTFTKFSAMYWYL